MTWSCKACTFDNSIDTAVLCSVCGTRRPLGKASEKIPTGDESEKAIHNLDQDGPRSTKRKAKKMAQQTLFGAIVTNRKEIPRKKQQLQDDKKDSSIQSILPNLDSSRKVVSNEHIDVLKARADEKMKSIFGIQSLRKLQPVAVELALKRQSQIIVMATGGGKSLCYQLPASVLGGVTLVISPLIALMVDQVNNLNKKGVTAALLSSSNGERNNKEVMARLIGRHVDKKSKGKVAKPLQSITLLYVTPELIQTERFRTVLKELYQKNKLTQFAIDEAHCLSTWGHDFRPAYRKLDWLRSNFPDIPCMACTATATAKVISDIRETLSLKEEEVPCNMSSFNRPNISYEVRYKDSLDAMKPGGAIGDLISLIKQQHEKASNDASFCSGIVYVHKRQDTSFIANQITSTAGIQAAPYHAGLKDADRKMIQENWTAGKIKVAVATVAFGMGIDLAHVRYVIHWSMAKTVDGFYQESGRAGRDGHDALSVLYYSKEDYDRFEFIIAKSAQAKGASRASSKNPLEGLQQMRNYCIVPGCRRKFLLKHYGETIDSVKVCNKTCDYCKNPSKLQKSMRASDVVKDVLKSASKYSRSLEKSAQWDGQWSEPHGDEVGYDGLNDSMMDGDLVIMPGLEGYQNVKQEPLRENKGFEKASSILSKYKRMEDSKASLSNKAVHSVPKPIQIPEHFRISLPDPFGHLAKQNKNESQQDTSSGLADRAAQLRESLEKLKAQRAAKLEALKAKTKCLAKPPPPPPSLSFKK